MSTMSRAAGAKTPAAAAASDQKTEENTENAAGTFTLASGKRIVMRRGFGRDLAAAAMAAQGKGQFEVSLAYIVQVCTIDGQKEPFEALLDWPADELLELMAKSENGFFVGAVPASSARTPSPAPSPSPAI